MLECQHCGAEMTELEAIVMQKADEETREIVETVGRFCSISCGETFDAERGEAA